MLRCCALWVALVSTTATSVWPAAGNATSTNAGTINLVDGFKFVQAGSSATLDAAFARYEALLGSSGAYATGTGISEVSVKVAPGASDKLSFGVDETYTLTITGSTATIAAATPYGALHGLNTFVQLADDYGPVAQDYLSVPSEMQINDGPRFAWRGLMIDTARHYYPLDFVKHVVDTMAASKLNILHIHFTDDQSFPIESITWPKLTAAGAFRDPSGRALTYSQADLKDLVAFAASRGVIVVPEFDMPAHTSAWGAGYPEFLAQTAGALFVHGDALRPDLDSTYAFLDSLLGELAPFFGDSEFLHLGGDELPQTSWAGNATVAAWMKDKGFDNDMAMSYFVNRVKAGEKLVAANKTLVYWEEVFASAGKDLPAGTVVQAWKSNAMPAAIAAGHRVTNSYKWYLNQYADRGSNAGASLPALPAPFAASLSVLRSIRGGARSGCNNFGDGNWPAFYENEPLDFVPKTTPAEQLALVVGGETTMWAECVDSVIFDSIVWPRAAAAAEKLWSPRSMTTHATADVVARLAEHRCRLVSRGVRAAPLNDGGSKIVPGFSADPRTFVGGCV